MYVSALLALEVIGEEVLGPESWNVQAYGARVNPERPL